MMEIIPDALQGRTLFSMNTSVTFLSFWSLNMVQATYIAIRIDNIIIIIIEYLTLPRLHFWFSASKMKALHWSSMKEQTVAHIVLDLALEVSFFRSNRLSQAQTWNSPPMKTSAALAWKKNIWISVFCKSKYYNINLWNFHTFFYYFELFPFFSYLLT